MRGIVAKAIRKIIYRDVPRIHTLKKRYVKDPETGTIYATDERRSYQDAKRVFKQQRRQ